MQNIKTEIKGNILTISVDLTQIVAKAVRDERDASIGQAILDNMGETGITPQQVHEEFLNNVYDMLPEDVRQRFNSLIERQTGAKVGEQWADHKAIAREMIEVGDDVDMLEGTERGFVAFEAEAIKRFGKPIDAYERLLKECGNNFREALSRVESGIMLN